MRDREKQRAYNRRYRQEHKEEIRAYQQKYRQEHKQEACLYMKRYRQEHAAEIREQERQYREAHKQQYRAYARKRREEQGDALRAYGRKYNREHAEEIRAYEQKYRQTQHGRAVHGRNQRRRRTLQARLCATFTEAQWQHALAYFDNCCAYCGASGVPLEQDHVVSLANGGGYVARNIVPACQRCNRSKWSSPLLEWAVGRSKQFVLPEVIEHVAGYFKSIEVMQ